MITSFRLAGRRPRRRREVFIDPATAQSQPSQNYRAGVLLVLLGGTASSSIGVFVRLIEDATAWQLLFYRSISLTLFLILVVAVRNRGRVLAVFDGFGPATMIGGVGLALAFCGIVVSIQVAPVANAMFLLAAAPFLAAILGWLILRERVAPATWIAIFTAFAGVGVMVAEGLSLGYLWGNVAGFVAALGYALFAIGLRWGRVGDMLPCAVLAGFIGIVVAGGLCLIDGSGIALDFRDMLLALTMGVAQLGLALVFITTGSRSVPAAEIPLIGLGEAVLAPLWVWLLLGETAGIFTLLGGALVLAAIGGDALAGIRRSRARGVVREPQVS
ncbi:MAG: DMT family transporter [Alphaproteobacteria bacterium]|nr:DMT family transporter [Alphaproteobacteria bacterium]